jgi:hypothetical protein
LTDHLLRGIGRTAVDNHDFHLISRLGDYALERSTNEGPTIERGDANREPDFRVFFQGSIPPEMRRGTDQRLGAIDVVVSFRVSYHSDPKIQLDIRLFQDANRNQDLHKVSPPEYFLT